MGLEQFSKQQFAELNSFSPRRVNVSAKEMGDKESIARGIVNKFSMD